jgi:YVTN family beta-propeller protein
MHFFRTLRDRVLWLVVCAVSAQLVVSQLTADTLYVCNQGIGTISVVDAASGDIKTSIISPDPLVLIPNYLVTTPDGRKAYVVYDDSDQISAIDLPTCTITKTFTMQAAVDPTTAAMPLLAMSPDGAKLYVVHTQNCSVSVIDVATDAVVKLLAVGNEEDDWANAIAISPDGKTAYVTRSSLTGGALVGICTETDEIVGTIPFQEPSSPSALAITPDGARAYVGEVEGSIIIVDLKSKSVVGSIQQGCEPCSIAFAPDGCTAYIALGSGIIQIVDVARDAIIGNIETASVVQVVFSSDGKTAFANDQLENQITVIDVAQGTRLKTLTGYSYPLGLALTPLPVPRVVSSQIPSTPTTCQAKIKKVPGRKGEGLLVLSWKQSPSPEVVRYDVYLNNERISSIPSSETLCFSMPVQSPHLKRKHSSKKHLRRLMMKYSVRAVTASGQVSQPVYPKAARR